MKLKVGDRVKYVGSNFPNYFGKVYEVESILNDDLLSLMLPKEERMFYELENMGTWEVSSFYCRIDDVEILNRTIDEQDLLNTAWIYATEILNDVERIEYASKHNDMNYKQALITELGKSLLNDPLKRSIENESEGVKI